MHIDYSDIVRAKVTSETKHFGQQENGPFCRRGEERVGCKGCPKPHVCDRSSLFVGFCRVDAIPRCDENSWHICSAALELAVEVQNDLVHAPDVGYAPRCDEEVCAAFVHCGGPRMAVSAVAGLG